MRRARAACACGVLVGGRGRYTACGIKFPEGGVVFDVGANIGMFSLMSVWVHTSLRALRGLGLSPTRAQASRMRAGRVFAFEPIPDIFQCLRANCVMAVRGTRVTVTA